MAGKTKAGCERTRERIKTFLCLCLLRGNALAGVEGNYLIRTASLLIGLVEERYLLEWASVASDVPEGMLNAAI